MKTISPEELAAILKGHGEWLRGVVGGSRAVLTGADLRDADLTGADLTGAVLRDADLRDADLRDAALTGADLRGAVLRDAVLTGAVLRGAVLRDADLTGAVLRDAVLTGADLRGAVLRDADLTGAVLRGAVLRDADLTGAVLRDADLRDAALTGADLRDADGLEIADLIAVKSLNRKILAAISSGGELEMGNWHSCETTHCRAGWAIHLAGAAGKVLEWSMGPAAAGALIYVASCPEINGVVPNFYATNDEALADIERLAAMEPEIV